MWQKHPTLCFLKVVFLQQQQLRENSTVVLSNHRDFPPHLFLRHVNDAWTFWEKFTKSALRTFIPPVHISLCFTVSFVLIVACIYAPECRGDFQRALVCRWTSLSDLEQQVVMKQLGNQTEVQLWIRAARANFEMINIWGHFFAKKIIYLWGRGLHKIASFCSLHMMQV